MKEREREIERVREIGYYVWDWECVCVKSKCIAINQWRGTKPAKLFLFAFAPLRQVCTICVDPSVENLLRFKSSKWVTF